MTNSHRTAPKVLLSSRSHIGNLEGLHSVAGAQEVISLIKARKTVTVLDLSHNELGDDGCRELFRYLTSEDGRRYKIGEISLKDNKIGAHGLSEIAHYLVDNSHLRTLRLQNNAFECDKALTLSFVSAVNASHLADLSLATNNSLSDAFVSSFLTHLNTPHLRSLDLSATRITALTTESLVNFLVSARGTYIETLNLSMNDLDFRSVCLIVNTIQRHNFSLLRMEIYANGIAEEGKPGEDREASGTSGNIARTIHDLKRVLLRNDLLTKKTRDSAVALLPYARALLIQTRRCRTPPPGSTDEPIDQPVALPSLPSSKPLQPKSHTVFPFCLLPMELQHYTLKFIAPFLSSAQFTRIFNYACEPSTLPPLLPRLRGPGCIPDPSSLPFGMPRSGGCGGGQCMGPGNSVLCHRIKERDRWLAEVGCDRFEPTDGLPMDINELLRNENGHTTSKSP
ncbi:RNI-like protein [Rickenella mellea]|uniref:RNI-like protein n=1 Tax=Rickenella mellea TaxID=50990 RepID=A0A4Y7QNE8_9AGAM|nr:RNI-like protein [Rickenella mellea]